jgi:hypothetical protein
MSSVDITINSSTVFWIMAACTLAGVYQRFGGTYLPHCQGRNADDYLQNCKLEDYNPYFFAVFLKCCVIEGN